MKNFLLAAAIVLQTLLAGCATVGGGVWPVSTDPNEYYWHAPQRMASAEDAIGAIKNLRDYFVETSGWTIDTLDIDKFGLRASGTWSEKSQQWVPSSGGFFSGSTYVPVYGGSVQTTSQQKRASFAIAFDALASLTLVHLPTINRPFKWGVVVRYKGDVPAMLLRVRSKEEAQRLVMAIETLAVERGYDYVDSGLRSRDLTAEQRAELGLTDEIGFLITYVEMESPGEKAGLRAGDVVTAIGKEPMRDGDSFSKAYAGRQTWSMFRREQGDGDYKPVLLKIDFPRIGGNAEAAQKVEDYWFMPARMASADQAVGTVKNLQQDIVGYGGWRIEDLEVDRFGMRAKGKDAMLIIPFDEVSRLFVERFVAQKDYQWGLVVTFSTERQPIALRTSSEKIARRLGDAIGTLAMEQGVRVLAGAGMRLRDSTAEDRQAVDFEGEYGVAVFSVFGGGPAEKAGLRGNDLIVEVGGVRAVKTADVIQAILKAEAEAKPLVLKLLRLDGDTIYEHMMKLQFGAKNDEPATKGSGNP